MHYFHYLKKNATLWDDGNATLFHFHLKLFTDESTFGTSNANTLIWRKAGRLGNL